MEEKDKNQSPINQKKMRHGNYYAYLHFLHEGQMVVVCGHSLHKSVLSIEDNFLPVSVVRAESMESVRVGHPTNQTLERK